jgi:hypothetical protein
MTTNSTSKKITVNNFEQAIIFMHEMLGQLSDGFWENSIPRDHWNWVDGITFDSFVVDPDADPHPNFYQTKHYNFADAELLNIVGERIINSIKLYKLYPAVWEHFKNDHWSIPDGLADYERTLAQTDEYWTKRISMWSEAGLTEGVLNTVWASDCYTMRDLRHDCRVLKTAILR